MSLLTLSFVIIIIILKATSLQFSLKTLELFRPESICKTVLTLMEHLSAISNVDVKFIQGTFQ